jgi:trk system potassium uptake protein TrkH
MRRRLAETPLLVVLCAVTGCLTFVPAIHGVATGQYEAARAFFYSGLILLILTAMLWIATAAYSPRDIARSQLGSLVSAFFILPLIMVLPLLEAVPDTSFVNAWFEMTSSFTTTGASVFAPDRLSDTVHLWRACIGWFGGLLTLLGAFAILTPLNLGGVEVATGRVPGRGTYSAAQVSGSVEPSDRMVRLAIQLLRLFTALTLLLWCGLMLMGDGATTALIHAMGTLSTSGISGQTGFSSAAAGVPGELLVLGFLVFAISHRAHQRLGIGFGRSGRLHDDPELRLAAVLVLLVTAILLVRHGFAINGGNGGAGQMLAALWGAVFTATSFLTTTGYVSADWQDAAQWSGIGPPGLILLGLAMVGGGTATTAGGVKLLRVLALLRQTEHELQRIVHPNLIGGGGADARRLRREGAQLAWVFFMLFAAAIALVVACLTLLGLDFQSALVLAIAALTTTGQLAELGSADPISYAALSDPVKLVLGLAMIVGRLETLALFAFFLPLLRRDD